MADLGTITEIVNASELTLEVGADVYVALTDLTLHIARPEERTASTGLGSVYTYGKGDNWFRATLEVTTPELGDVTPSFNFLTKTDANGDLPSRAWKIVAKDKAGATKTYAVDGVLPEYELKKPQEGTVIIDIFVRITGDSATIT